jgi:hypothetical protein
MLRTQVIQTVPQQAQLTLRVCLGVLGSQPAVMLLGSALPRGRCTEGVGASSGTRVTWGQQHCSPTRAGRRPQGPRHSYNPTTKHLTLPAFSPLPDTHTHQSHAPKPRPTHCMPHTPHTHPAIPSQRYGTTHQLCLVPLAVRLGLGHAQGPLRPHPVVQLGLQEAGGVPAPRPQPLPVPHRGSGTLKSRPTLGPTATACCRAGAGGRASAGCCTSAGAWGASLVFAWALAPRLPPRGAGTQSGAARGRVALPVFLQKLWAGHAVDCGHGDAAAGDDKVVAGPTGGGLVLAPGPCLTPAPPGKGGAWRQGEGPGWGSKVLPSGGRATNGLATRGRSTGGWVGGDYGGGGGGGISSGHVPFGL